MAWCLVIFGSAEQHVDLLQMAGEANCKPNVECWRLPATAFLVVFAASVPEEALTPSAGTIGSHVPPAEISASTRKCGWVRGAWLLCGRETRSCGLSWSSVGKRVPKSHRRVPATAAMMVTTVGAAAQRDRVAISKVLLVLSLDQSIKRGRGFYARVPKVPKVPKVPALSPCQP